jgi:Mrp family chromosome partitioning ATPase/capsular polysaccharide biosynthesis protein
MALDAESGPAATAGVPEPALGPYLRAVRRNWLLVVVITLLTGAVATATALRSGLTYQASATVLVSPLQQGDANFLDTGVVIDTGEPVRTVQTAAALIDSQPAAQATATTMGRGWTVARVQGAVSVTPLGQSDILDVTAQASTAAQAAMLANTFAQAAVGYRATIVQHNISTQLSELSTRLNRVVGPGIASASLAQQLATRIAALRAAQVGGGDPTLAVTGLARTGSPTGASHWLVILLSLIGGLAIGSVAALAFDFFNRRVRDLDEIETLFPVPVLATVPKIDRGGDGGDLPPGAFSPAAFEQVRMLRVQLSNRERAPVIMLTSPGAGDGKTTLATALASAFAETGDEVILMDLDLRKPGIAPLLGLKSPRDVNLVDATLEELLVEVPDLQGVRVLPAPHGDATLFPLLFARLPKLLDEAKVQADHVVIDTAPVGFASESLQVAGICDQVVVAVWPGHTDRQRLFLARDLLARAGAPVVGVVVTLSTAETYGYGYGYGAADGRSLARPASKSTTLRRPRTDAESALGVDLDR